MYYTPAIDIRVLVAHVLPRYRSVLPVSSQWRRPIYGESTPREAKHIFVMVYWLVRRVVAVETPEMGRYKCHQLHRLVGRFL